MVKERQVVEEALARLTLDTSIQGYWNELPTDNIDGELNLLIDGKPFRAYIEVKRELRQYQLPQLMQQARLYQPFMVVAEHIFPTIKEKLRKEKIAYIDIAGNIFINAGQTYVWIDGRKHTQKNRTATNRAFTKTGLKAVFYILLNPDAINMPYRQLAQNADVALGNIQNILDGLNESGFILQRNKREKILKNKKALLTRWIEGYREILKPALHIGNYSFWDKNKINNWHHLKFPEHANAFWGGEGAAAELTKYLNPMELTLYTDNKSPFVTNWTLIPDKKGKLHIYEKFWHDIAAEYKHLAPPLLVYADLILTDDPRCIETAELVYNKYLKSEFER